MAASQNGLCSYKLSINRKTNIMQIMTKNIKIFICLIFNHREIVKLDYIRTLSLSYADANAVQWCSRCKIHRFVAAPFSHSHEGQGCLPLFHLADKRDSFTELRSESISQTYSERPKWKYVLMLKITVCTLLLHNVQKSAWQRERSCKRILAYVIMLTLK